MKTQKTFDNQELLTYIVKNLLTDPEICAALKNLATILNEKISMQLSYSIAKSALKTAEISQSTKINKHNRRTNWNNATAAALRSALAYRKKTAKPIEPELNAALVKRFPNYDSKTQTFANGCIHKRKTNWDKATKNSLRIAFSRRKRNSKPIEPELNAALAKRFPNYDSKTQTFPREHIKKRATHWDKSTANSLHIAFRYRRKHNKLIEPELNAALAKRFPNYDSKTQTFTRVHPKTHNRRTNWNKATAAALRSALAYRKKTAKPIEPELNAALVKRFPNYDSKTQTFANGCIHKRKTNWDKATKNSLRIAFSRRKRNSKPIEPELNAALAKRFPNYDSKTQTFPREHIKKRATHWDKSTANSLHIAFRYRRKHNKLIEPELNAALAKRFPNYDSKTQTFTRVHPKTHNRRTNWNKATAAALRSAFAYRKKTDKPIEPELNTALANQFPDYDPKTQRFTRERGRTTTYGSRLLPLFSHITQRNTYALRFNNRQTGQPLLHSATAPYDLCLLDTKMHIAIVRKPIALNKNLLFIIDYVRGTVIPESKTGLESVSYNATAHEFITTPKKYNTVHHWVLSPSHNTTKTMFIPSQYPSILANAAHKQTIIIDDNGITTTHPNMQLPQQDCHDTLNRELQKILSSRPEPQKVVPQTQQTPPTTTIKTSKPNVDEQSGVDNTATTTLTVTVKPIKTTLDGTYNNVFINGEKILSNHLNTRIDLLYDNRLLAIHGIVTDNPNMPQIPTWQVYDTQLQSKIPTHKQKYNNYSIYSTHIHTTAEGMHIRMSNRAVYYIKAQRIIQESGKKRFILDNQKTR